MDGRRVRLAVLTPLAVSALTAGAVTAAAPPAAAASPTCGVSRADGPTHLEVVGEDFEPDKAVFVESAHGAEGTVRTDAAGAFSATISHAAGTVSARQVGGPEVRCGTAEQGARMNAQEQYAAGYKAGYAAMKNDCDVRDLKRVPVNDNFRNGFEDGAAAAGKKFCEG
ncbi:hypothetical protein KBP30_14750 [Streptomyces sp. Go40/10]|uniref:hypothetical protein n=1 Tax=Streptomyces sp. Go40/10 TaxID=2825844 RepID=UPI001E2CB650|nr:hypothetical protein [Streptomyces sp. Go40/10]UFR02363.1 hypothetical protein KBP30_14750 [Streptomyces sp. Go40/10]